MMAEPRLRSRLHAQQVYPDRFVLSHRKLRIYFPCDIDNSVPFTTALEIHASGNVMCQLIPRRRGNRILYDYLLALLKDAKALLEVASAELQLRQRVQGAQSDVRQRGSRQDSME